jgi:hypothetical protein
MLAKRRVRKLNIFLSIVIACVALFGCAKPAPPHPVAEQPPSPPSAVAASQPTQPAPHQSAPVPKTDEVQEAVTRVFKNAVAIDTTRSPGFLVGDFNGDSSQDLAVILRPAQGMLSELNQEFPNWIAREPLKEVLLPKSKVLAHPVASRPAVSAAAGQTVRFEQSDVLWAIIHGSGPKGWRDSEATQTHLLRDVVGSDVQVMPYKAAEKAYKGIKPFPTIYGDLIQQTLIGQSGFLHFSGGIYAWYDRKNYKSELVPVHSMSAIK